MVLPKTLPASWYTSDKLLDLAKDKIFNKGWHFIAPITKFVSSAEPASQFDLIANPFFVLNNVSDLYMDTLDIYYGVFCEGIDLGKCSKVKHHLTDSGLLFVSHDANVPEFGEFYGAELEDMLKSQNFRSMSHRRKLVYECDYGFLTFIDGYQECLHCSYTHPGLAKAYCLDFYKVETYSNFCRHITDSSDGESDPGLFLYFFPTCSLNYYAGGMSVFRCCPISGSKCRMEFDYFFDGSNDKFEEYYKFARQVAVEDIELCEACQRNLNMGVYQGGVLNPDKERGVIYYQKLVKEKILAL